MGGTVPPSVKPRTAEVWLYQGDDEAELQRLLAEVTATVAEQGPARESDGTQAVEAYNAFVEVAKGRAVVVRLRAIPRAKYREMVDAATETVEVTDTDADGEQVKREVERVNDILFAESLVPASVVEPVFDTDSQRQAFLDDLSDADFSALYTEAVRLNQSRGIANPKALRVSELMGSDDETSSSPGR